MTQVRDALPVVSGELQILYFVHDLFDQAVRRRVAMLQAGGAQVTLAGFRRGAAAVAPFDGVQVIDLGRTEDARFDQRLAAILRASLTIKSRLDTAPPPQLIMARNLEMLAVARRAKAAFGWASTPVVYECLDIHRLVLRGDAVGAALRATERWLGRGVSLLITSSPAFVANYFAPYRQIGAPLELIENRHLELVESPALPVGLPAAPPWRIGWFGVLRCRRSLELLAAFTRAEQGRYQVVLRGKPTQAELPDFDEFVANEPYMSFEGPYRNPEDIAQIYGSVHFAWAIDFFERGQNSEWLLPNRIYEGCRFGAVPIVMRGTEAAKFAAERGIGVELGQDTVSAIRDALRPIAAERYATLRAGVLSKQQSFAYGPADCRKLVARLAGLLPASPFSGEGSVVATAQ